jgi:hypothetical protein
LLQAHRLFQRRNGLFVSLQGNQAKTPAHVRIPEIYIQLGCSRKVNDRLFPLRLLSRHFSQDEFRPGVPRVDLQLFLKFHFGAFGNLGIHIRARKQRSSQQVVDARRIGLFFDHLFVFALRFIPSPLHFQGFGIQLMRGDGLRRRAPQVLRGTRGKIGIRMNQDEKNLRIPGELLAQKTYKLKRGFATVQRQGAAQAQNAGFFPRFLRTCGAHGAFECGDSFLTASLFRKRHAFFVGQCGVAPDMWSGFWCLTHEG